MIGELARRLTLCRPLDPLVSRSAGHTLCWYCAKQLPHHFTSVVKDGRTLPVHYNCRAQAELLIAGAVIQDNPDYDFNEGLPIG